jgi:hypothetical protein
MQHQSNFNLNERIVKEQNSSTIFQPIVIPVRCGCCEKSLPMNNKEREDHNKILSLNQQQSSNEFKQPNKNRKKNNNNNKNKNDTKKKKQNKSKEGKNSKEPKKEIFLIDL